MRAASLLSLALVASGLPLGAGWPGPPALECVAHCPRWEQGFAGAPGSPDFPRALEVSPDGARLYAAARRGDGGEHLDLPSFDFVTLAYDARTGEPLWQRLYGTPGVQDSPLALRLAPDGSRVFVAGPSYGADGAFAAAALAYDALDGAPRWEVRHAEPGSGYNVARALAVSPDGSLVFVAGSYIVPGSGDADHQVLVLALDAASGAERWVARAGGAGVDVAHAAAVSPDGSLVFVTGRGADDGEAWDFLTVAFDAATGAQRWAARYEGPDGGEDVAIALGVAPDGSRVYAAGWSEGEGTGDDVAVVAYDAGSGRRAWEARFDGQGGVDVPQALRVSPDGSLVFVAGRTGGAGDRREDHVLGYCPRAGHDYLALAFRAADGSLAWTRTYDGAGGEDCAYGLALAPGGGRVYVTGGSEGPGACAVTEPARCAHAGLAMLTVAVDASSGAFRGAARFAGLHAAWGQAAAAGPGGLVFVAGSRAERPIVFGAEPAPTERSLDMVTLAYDASDLGG